MWVGVCWFSKLLLFFSSWLAIPLSDLLEVCFLHKSKNRCWPMPYSLTYRFSPIIWAIDVCIGREYNGWSSVYRLFRASTVRRSFVFLGNLIAGHGLEQFGLCFDQVGCVCGFKKLQDFVYVWNILFSNVSVTAGVDFICWENWVEINHHRLAFVLFCVQA